jgi:hypothetical protein
VLNGPHEPASMTGDKNKDKAREVSTPQIFQARFIDADSRARLLNHKQEEGVNTYLTRTKKREKNNTEL